MLLPQEHTVMVRQTGKWGQILLLSLIGLGATAFATAWFYRLDEVITVPGRLVPQQGGVEIKSPISGQLVEVMVKSGEKVSKGQHLLRFNVESTRAKHIGLTARIKLEKERLQDELESNNQRAKTLKRNVSLTLEILKRLRPLKEAGSISELQILQQQNQLETLKDELEQAENNQKKLENESNNRMVELTGALTQINSELRNEVVEAPIAGTIFDLSPDNDQYVTRNGESLLKIIPDGKLNGEVNVGNRDIGFIRTGQKVKVRVDSFPYTEYGDIKGEISQLGADALTPTELIPQYHFPVILNLERSELQTRNGKTIPLQAGMTITTNLKLRDRRLISLLSDIFSTRGESLQRLRQP